MKDNAEVDAEPVEEPDLGWAARITPKEVHQRQARSEFAKRWISGRNLLLLSLVVWNGVFLTDLAHSLSQRYRTPSNVLAIEIWIWIVGNLAILLIAWAVRTALQGRDATLGIPAKEQSVVQER
jgi:hypothetical protein